MPDKRVPLDQAMIDAIAEKFGTRDDGRPRPSCDRGVMTGRPQLATHTPSVSIGTTSAIFMTPAEVAGVTGRGEAAGGSSPTGIRK